MLINRTQSEILEYLGGWFGFLTVSQIMLLTGKKSAGYIREMLGSLRRHGYVRSFRIEVSQNVRSENMYSIAPIGAELLLSTKSFATIKAPVASPLIVKDFFHRYNTVSTLIGFYLHFKVSSINIEQMLFYFDKLGSAKGKNLTAKTSIHIKGHGIYIPDSILKTEKTLYLIECYCDRNSARIIESLAIHAKGISAGSAAGLFNLSKNPKIVSVFEHEGIMKAVILKLQQNEKFTKPMSDLFFFATINDLKENISNAFKTINGELLVID